jgi:hypothetical protein
VLITLQFIALYAAIAFVPIVIARLFAGTRGAREVAQFVFVRGPLWLITSTFWLVADCVMAFAPRRSKPLDERFMAPEQEDGSLFGKLDRMRREQMGLITRLADGELHQANLTRAFELGLIDEVSVRHDESNGGWPKRTSYTTSISLVIRAPRIFDEAGGASSGKGGS